MTQIEIIKQKIEQKNVSLQERVEGEEEEMRKEKKEE